jgi:hypothetical protein
MQYFEIDRLSFTAERDTSKPTERCFSRDLERPPSPNSATNQVFAQINIPRSGSPNIGLKNISKAIS